MRRQTTKTLIITLLLLLLPSMVLATGFTNQQQLHFTGTSANPGTLYQDGVGGNANVGLRLCGVGQQFAGVTYRLNAGGTDHFSLISYSSSTLALSNLNNNVGGGCFEVAPGFMTVSPSELTTPNPTVRKAAFPGRLWVGYAGNANPGTINNFVFAGDNARLRGSYSVGRSFDQATNQVSVQTPQITFQTQGGSFTRAATDSSFGIASDRPIVMGICTDEAGADCSDGEVISTPAFPRSYSTGIPASQINDQNTHTRNVVINGLGYDFCIGANLRPTITTIEPNPVYFSQFLAIEANVQNVRNTPFETRGGNIEVTTPFNVLVEIIAPDSSIAFTQTIPISTNLEPDAIVPIGTTWEAIGQSGIYTLRVTVDPNGAIAQCPEAFSDVTTQQFELLPITLPQIRIDGVLTDEFPQANLPYDLDIFIENSDGDILSNASVRIVEENGLNIMAPTQIFNRTTGPDPTDVVQDGLRAQNIVNFRTDFSGEAQFTFIPTFNQLYQPEYAYLSLEDHIGSYSLFLDGVQEDGQEFRFIDQSDPLRTLQEEYELTILNTTLPSSFTQKTIPNQLITSQVLDFIYRTFTNFLQSVN